MNTFVKCNIEPWDVPYGAMTIYKTSFKPDYLDFGTLVVQFIFNSICSQYINKRVHKWLVYTQVTRDTLNSQWRLLTVPP